MAFGDQLVAGGTAFGLRALRGQQVTEARRAADQLSGGGNLEALGNGLFGLLHGWSWPRQSADPALARGIFHHRGTGPKASRARDSACDFQRENAGCTKMRKCR